MSADDKGVALTLRQPGGIAAYEPQDFPQAMQMAATLGKAANLTPEVTYLKMAAGFAHRIPAVTALRWFDIIDGPNGTKQVAPRAQAMVAMCLAEPAICEYFEFVEGDDKSCTWRAKRKGRPEQTMTYTIEQAKKAKLIRDGGNWEKDPAAQLDARASSRLARRVFSDVVGAMYSAEERDDVDASPAPVMPLSSASPATSRTIDSTATQEPQHDPQTGEVHDAPPHERTAEQTAVIRALGGARTDDALAAARKALIAIWPKMADAPEDVQALYREAKQRVEAIKKEQGA